MGAIGLKATAPDAQYHQHPLPEKRCLTNCPLLFTTTETPDEAIDETINETTAATR